MTDAAAGQTPLPRLTIGPGGWGRKAILVFVLAVLMAIPGLFVFALVADRTHRAQTVTQEVSALQGGAQHLLGPMLVAPYVIPPPPRPPGDTSASATPVTGWYLVSPETGSARLTVEAASLHRGIFEVPVYDARAELVARFAPPPKSLNLANGGVVDWSQARLVVGLSDLRGAKSDFAGELATAAGGGAVGFGPVSGLDLGSGGDSGGSNGGFDYATAPAAALTSAPDGGTVKLSVRFTGAERISVLPFAKSTTVSVTSDGGSPSFDGGFLPDHRSLTGHRFSAVWNVPFIARGLSDHGTLSALSVSALSAKDLGVTFVPANNPYTNVGRALKYAVMFVGLVFLTFFVFEALSGRRLHPAQYLMIGLAQMVFYLLLLSLSEYVGFDLAFTAAATATVALIGLYAGAAFRSRAYGGRALAIFAVVYGLIYLLMRLEDFALLAGSLATFVGLALAMYLTRNIDWYGPRPAQDAKAPPGAPGA
ncbi:MAG: cell envelope integrity protein CreD [Caulobacteraceae bacterium]|nr:cell envelope integrity protein CreD [Caulobacteraceae bacterium]